MIMHMQRGVALVWILLIGAGCQSHRQNSFPDDRQTIYEIKVYENTASKLAETEQLVLERILRIQVHGKEYARARYSVSAKKYGDKGETEPLFKKGYDWCVVPTDALLALLNTLRASAMKTCRAATTSRETIQGILVICKSRNKEWPADEPPYWHGESREFFDFFELWQSIQKLSDAKDPGHYGKWLEENRRDWIYYNLDDPEQRELFKKHFK